MFDRDGALALVRRVLSLSPAEQTELVLASGRSELTRFAENAITQNVSRSEDLLTIRLVSGRREGRANVDRFDDEGLTRALAAAWSLATLAKEDPFRPPVVERQPAYRPADAFVEATAAATPERRARAVADACRRCREHGMIASGAFATAAETTAYASSKGVFGFHAATSAGLSLTANGPDGASEGFALASDADVDRLDLDRVVRTAVEKARRARNPEGLPPGRYTVILEPLAVNDLLRFLSVLGFGAGRLIEGRSYVCGKIGQKLFSSKLTVRDDVHHPLLRGAPYGPFDCEGTAREAVPLVDRGIPCGVVWDRRTALRAGNGSRGARSTGHAVRETSRSPIADAIVMEGGDASLASMIRETTRGLLVTRLHYVNAVDPMRLTITGMTRGGLFLVEEGEVTRPVKNFRFTVSLLDVFSEANLDSLGPAERAGGLHLGVSVAPPMKAHEFHMTSGTEF